MTDVNLKIPNVSVNPSEALATVSVAPIVKEAISTSEDHPGLAIEQSPTGFVYKVLDKKTGDVIRQIPQKSLADLVKDPSYGAGDVIKTAV